MVMFRWLDDAPLKINDPSAVKPDDWDDDEVKLRDEWYLNKTLQQSFLI